MWLRCALLVTGLLARAAAAEPPAASFGPKEYASGPGAPVTLTERFDVCRPERALLRVENGPGGRPRVSSGTLSLNGVEVVRARDFNQRVELIERPVALAASNTLAIRLAGPPGGVVAVGVVGESSCVEIALTSPVPDAEVPAGLLTVRGTVRGAAGAGVAVNGMPAFVDEEAFVGLVPVDPGVQTLRADVRDLTGLLASDTIAVTVVASAGESPVTLRPSPPGGRIPLTVAFTLSSPVDGSQVALDADGDGVADVQGATLEGQTFTYTRAGVYTPTVRVTDAQGRVSTAVTLVQVLDPVALDAQLQAVWNGFKDAVRAGDLTRAAGFLHSDTRGAYQAQLALMSPGALANIDQFMTTIALVEVGFGGAEYEMLRTRDGQTLSFAVWFQLDQDGLWRLRRF